MKEILRAPVDKKLNPKDKYFRVNLSLKIIV
jgi:hypothetical protein